MTGAEIGLYKFLWILTPVLCGIIGFFYVYDRKRIDRDIENQCGKIKTLDKKVDQIDGRLIRVETLEGIK